MEGWRGIGARLWQRGAMKVFAANKQWLAEEGLRLDARTYSEGALEARDRILTSGMPWRTLGDVAEIINPGRFARNYVKDPSRGVRFLSSSDMTLLDLRRAYFVSLKSTPGLDRLRVKTGWTIVSRSGTVGRTVYVRHEMDGMALSEHALRIVPKSEEVYSGYVFAFLASSLGQAVLKQKAYGTVVQHIEAEHISGMVMPLFEDRDQLEIHNLVDSAARARTRAAEALSTITEHFDESITASTYDHDHARAMDLVPRASIRNRLDAFFYVGWAAGSQGTGGTRLGDLAEVRRPNVMRRIFVERGVPFVSGIDAYQARAPFRHRIMATEAQAAGARVQTGDILVQRSGQRYGLLGLPTYVSERMDGWAVSEDLIVISPADPNVGAWIFAYLLSEAGRRQLVRTSYGTSIPHLNPEGVRSIRLPKLSDSVVASADMALKLRVAADDDEQRAVSKVDSWLV